MLDIVEHSRSYSWQKTHQEQENVMSVDVKVFVIFNKSTAVGSPVRHTSEIDILLSIKIYKVKLFLIL